VVKVAACGVCGSDPKARPLLPLGTVMGHELGGEVVAAARPRGRIVVLGACERPIGIRVAPEHLPTADLMGTPHPEPCRVIPSATVPPGPMDIAMRRSLRSV